MAGPLSAQYVQQLAAEERSRVPVFIRFVRVVVWLIYAVVLVQVVILAMAFVLQLLNASTSAEFTQWVYRSADSAMGPFRGIFPAIEVGRGSVLNASLLFAALMYTVLAIVLDLGLRALTARLTVRERRLAELRGAARQAMATEYAAAQRMAVDSRAAASSAASDPTPSPGVAVPGAPMRPTVPGEPPPPPPSGGLRR